MRQNRRILLGMVIVVAAIAYFAFAGFQEGKAYYKTIEELSDMGEEAYDKPIRVGGIVAEGSIEREGSQLTFEIEQDEKKLRVRYAGTSPVPDTFKDGAEALCDGSIGRDGVFEAKSIQAKCASKYEAGYDNTAAEL